MDDLTPRQIDLLKAIILQHTETGEPVGSDILDKKYGLGVSPATIRNEMVELDRKEYLQKSYFSAGRTPTSKAYRFYIRNIMHERELSTAEEVSYKSDVWDFRHEFHQLLQHATQALARRTNMLAVATTNKGEVYYFGVRNVLSNREFWDIERAQSFLGYFDELDFWNDVMDKFTRSEEEIMYSFAEETDKSMGDIASVFGEFEGPNIRGVIGVMGPKRMKYETVVPNVRYFTSLIEDLVKVPQEQK